VFAVGSVSCSELKFWYEKGVRFQGHPVILPMTMSNVQNDHNCLMSFECTLLRRIKKRSTKVVIVTMSDIKPSLLFPPVTV
jgi:hypothetical protein